MIQSNYLLIFISLNGGCQSRPSQSAVNQVWSGGNVERLERSESEEVLFLINQGHEDQNTDAKIQEILNQTNRAHHLIYVGHIRKLLMMKQKGVHVGLLQDANQLLNQEWSCLVFPTSRQLTPSRSWDQYYLFQVDDQRNEIIDEINNTNQNLEWTRTESWPQLQLSKNLIGFEENQKTYQKKTSPPGWIWTSRNNLPSTILAIGKFLKRVNLKNRQLLITENRILKAKNSPPSEGIEPVVNLFPQEGQEYVTHYEICVHDN